MNQRKLSFFLMFMLVLLWGLDYSVAKTALEFFQPLNLMVFKYGFGFMVIAGIKLFSERNFYFRKKDLILFVLCALFGQLIYFLCEYTAMDYIPVSLITIILSFVPIVSIIIERIFFKKHFTARILVGLGVCVVGVTLVIGADLGALFQGQAIGYILAFAAVLCWNLYNFLTAKISKIYSSLNMSFNQLLCTCIILFPHAIATMPPLNDLSLDIKIGLVYLGVGSTGFGYLILVRGLRDLGPTISALFTNFLPVAATFFGFVILGETITPLQIVGGLVVIVASCYVILEREKQIRL